tara:strand:+ start:600 stop:1202 length:603 start_codon:yes stop_codon:yes gene_type:complete
MKGLYAILDENNFNFKNIERDVKQMIDLKIKIFQVRVKSSFSKEIIKAIKNLKYLCEQNGCLLILNDNISLAKNLNLDGIHIGSSDIDINTARDILGKKKIIGVSCYNSFSLALSAELNGASYVSFGSLYKTSTKLNPVNLDIKTFKKSSKVLKIPICLIGGINTSNVHDVIKLNCDLIAISKGLSSEKDRKTISHIYYE